MCACVFVCTFVYMSLNLLWYCINYVCVESMSCPGVPVSAASLHIGRLLF